MKTTILALILAMSTTVLAVEKKPEKYYQNEWCTQYHGQQEVVLPDKTRIDCVLSDSVVEFEFAHKFYEAIGQSLHYGALTGKDAGIVLILRSLDDYKYLQRLTDVITYYNLPIRVWVVKDIN